MRRTTSLTAACLTGLALMAPASTATAAGETCRGEAATIVGNRGTEVVGTEGRDVVVTNRSSSVKTLGGDDLVCITGPDAPADTEYGIRVDTGPGDDVVDGTSADSWSADVTLGAGADQFAGGDAEDYVEAGSYVVEGSTVRYLDEDVDVVETGGGSDLLSSGQVGVAGSDVLRGGPGRDGLDLRGPTTASAVVDGGADWDNLGLDLAAGSNTVDAAGEHRAGGQTLTRWTGVESFYLADPATGTAEVDIIGTAGDESFGTSGNGRVVADLGAGDDSFSAPALLPPGSSLAGGEGRDDFSFGTADHGIEWDLREGVVRVDDGRTIPATGFEDTFVSAPRVRLIGTDGPNRLWVNTCDGVLDGRNGRDSLDLSSDLHFEEFRSCAEKMVFKGGRGHDLMGSRAGSVDRMVGGRGNDHFSGVGGDDKVFGGPGNDRADLGRGNDTFYGGPGRDRVDGEQGRDLCRAERKVRCER